MKIDKPFDGIAIEPISRDFTTRCSSTYQNAKFETKSAKSHLQDWIFPFLALFLHSYSQYFFLPRVFFFLLLILHGFKQSRKGEKIENADKAFPRCSWEPTVLSRRPRAFNSLSYLIFRFSSFFSPDLPSRTAYLPFDEFEIHFQLNLRIVQSGFGFPIIYQRRRVHKYGYSLGIANF